MNAESIGHLIADYLDSYESRYIDEGACVSVTTQGGRKHYVYIV